jgi:CRISPR/Cas system CSM-associated protein Csm4 (group 5 of RAMP superfamily)
MKSSLLCNLGRGDFFPKYLHQANNHFTYSKKLKKIDNTTIPLLGGIVYRKIALIVNYKVQRDTYILLKMVQRA